MGGMTRPKAAYPRRTHVFIIDGTLSRLDDGDETNAGLLFKLLKQLGPNRTQTVGYHPGVQAEGFQKWINIAAGIGINRAIRTAYGAICSRYRPGDKIMLFGFSRGGYAVRSLAGLIDRVGLLRQEVATERRILRAFRYYEAERLSESARRFSDRYCHPEANIDVLGVWDTVKSLGLPYPILNRLAPMATEFHDHTLSNTIRHAYQALAIDETRVSYEPLPWKVEDTYTGHVEQVWFPGAHADVGGHVYMRPAARGLSNIPLNWMLEKAQRHGLLLPEDWESEFPENPGAPMHGSYRGTGRFFLARRPRKVGQCGSESMHPSVEARADIRKRYRPRAIILTERPQTSKERGAPGRIPSAQPQP